MWTRLGTLFAPPWPAPSPSRHPATSQTGPRSTSFAAFPLSAATNPAALPRAYGCHTPQAGSSEDQPTDSILSAASSTIIGIVPPARWRISDPTRDSALADVPIGGLKQTGP